MSFTATCFFSMFKNSIFTSCFHLYMAPSQRGRTLLSSYLVQNDCATNKKQTSSNHAHCMPFSVDFSTYSDLENHNCPRPKSVWNFFKTLCLANFVVLLSSRFWNIPVFAKYQSSSASAWDMTSGICSHRRGESLEVLEASSSFTIAIFVDG